MSSTAAGLLDASGAACLAAARRARSASEVTVFSRADRASPEPQHVEQEDAERDRADTDLDRPWPRLLPGDKAFNQAGECQAQNEADNDRCQ